MIKLNKLFNEDLATLTYIKEVLTSEFKQIQQSNKAKEAISNIESFIEKKIIHYKSVLASNTNSLIIIED